jgi:uncharacterized protein YecT (DUF1311 family)
VKQRAASGAAGCAVLLAACFAGAPSLALDCKLAASKAEKATCANPAALAADAEMTKAYGALHAALDPKQRAGLVKSQVQWLTDRDGACFDKEDAALASCLTGESIERRAFLSGAPTSGPGAPHGIVPSFRIEAGGKGRTDVDIEVLKFVNPSSAAEQAFNAAVDKMLGSVIQPGNEDSQRDDYAYSWKLRLAYASPRLLSAHGDGYSSMGGAHPNTFTADINVDVEAGREATFDSLLDKTAAQKVFALCFSQVVAAKKRAGEDNAARTPDALKTLREDVATATGDLKKWSFGADGATISYDPYAVGAYVEGDFSCKIPYPVLKPLAKSSFPLP